MPTLEFKGKQFVHAHHLSVPFRQLEIDKSKSFPKGNANLDDNLIIHGDNLHALKALLPTYAGKIKCIYIDPPYNTGNEGWCYNDKVRSPLMQEWIKKSGNPVDREDLERHDKWLCMMWPRLNLLRELLDEDGVIFISIDDNEVHNLRPILDEIFGESNFLAQLSVLCNPKGRVLGEHFARSHDYVLVYQNRNLPYELSHRKTGEEVQKQYPEKDEKGNFRPLELRNTHRQFGKKNRPNLYYPFFVDSKGRRIQVLSATVSKDFFLKN
ncbi:MAG: site-specific DNA-methyltransferase, partial [Nitrospinales bacterium]